MSDIKKDDWRLLRQYLDHNSQAAFTALLERHLKLVYWTCRRDLPDAQLAEDATQVVFVLFAEKAHSLRSSLSIAGWLFNTARFVARDALKREAHRRRHEVQTAMDEVTAATTDPRWNDFEPWVNDALSRLKPAEREAILLRFFEGATLQEVASQVGTTEEAARKRITRAVEKLRFYAQKRGIVFTSTALAALLAAHAAKALPQSAHALLLHTIPSVTAAQAGLPAGTSVAYIHKGVLSTMKAAKLKMIASIATGLLAVFLAGFLGLRHMALADGANSVATPDKAVVTLQFEVLSTAPGLYDRITHPANGKTVAGDQVYPALIQAGAKVLETPRIAALPGTQAAISIGRQVQTAETTPELPPASPARVGTTTEATTRLAPNGTVMVSVTCTRTEQALEMSAGKPPATNSESITASTPVDTDHDSFIGKLQAMPGYGDQTDQVIFARLISVKTR